MGFWSGSPGQIHQVSRLRKDQEGLSNQLVQAGQQQGAGGAFGTAADYYRDLLSQNPQALQSYINPALRQYNEEIVPGLSEQFAGMGAGGLGSSGFRNAQISGATDLAERIGQIRANLQSQGAAGLTNIGQLGLQDFQQNYQTQGSPGFLQSVAPYAGAAIGAIYGGPAGAALGYSAGNWLSGGGGGAGGQAGTTQPYGGQIPKASASASMGR